jgi:nucleotide-binding universal stress UspA family protein
MFKHILVATDGSTLGDKAVAYALQLAGGARISALLVVPDYDMAGFAWATFTNGPDAQQLRKHMAAAGRKQLDAALARHGDAARRIERLVAVNDRPYAEIVETAAREHCDLVVMARHGRGPVVAALMGSQTTRVLALSSVPVLVLP